MKGILVGSDDSLSRLVKSFYVDRPVRQNVFPQWEFSVVLSGLRLEPFVLKEMSKVGIDFLTYKTVFLVMLASGAHRGEMHALDYARTSWSEDGNEITL